MVHVVQAAVRDPAAAFRLARCRNSNRFSGAAAAAWRAARRRGTLVCASALLCARPLIPPLAQFLRELSGLQSLITSRYSDALDAESPAAAAPAPAAPPPAPADGRPEALDSPAAQPPPVPASGWGERRRPARARSDLESRRERAAACPLAVSSSNRAAAPASAAAEAAAAAAAPVPEMAPAAPAAAATSTAVRNAGAAWVGVDIGYKKKVNQH